MTLRVQQNDVNIPLRPSFIPPQKANIIKIHNQFMAHPLSILQGKKDPYNKSLLTSNEKEIPVAKEQRSNIPSSLETF